MRHQRTVTLFATIGAAAGVSAQGYTIGTFAGTAAGATLGWSVAIVGDVDGDDQHDLLIGTPGATVSGQPNAGLATLHSGRTGAVLQTVLGSACCGYLGSSTAGVGDVNGDGVPDFAVGAPELGNGGQVLIVSGLGGAPLLTLNATAMQDQFGYSLAGVGDVDGDGRADFAVGAPNADPNGVVNAGRVVVYSGASGAVLRTWNGALGFDNLGHSVAGVGDVDGDGVPDVAAGAVQPGFGPTYPVGPGYLIVGSGATGTVLRLFTGTTNGDRFGTAVSGPGDVDGDGRADVLIGAPGAAGQAGEAKLFSGATGAVLLLFPGSPPADRQGFATTAAGDVNGDGVPDVAIGAPGFGVGGRATIFSGANGTPVLSVSGANLGDNLGYSLSGAGDLDGDGAPDLLVGLPFAHPGGLAAAGEALAVSFLGIPAGSSAYGTGCTGALGVPTNLTAGGAPTSGGNAAFALHLADALPNAACLGVLGLSNTVWGGVPLPLGLGPFGIPGCHLLVSPDAVLALATNAAGRSVLRLPVPPVPALAGTSIYVQWYVVDPGPTLTPGAMSRGLQVVIL